MKPYSIDFRQKIIRHLQKRLSNPYPAVPKSAFLERSIDVRKREKISIRKLAERFDVAKSFVQKLLKQEGETGEISPKPQGGSPPPKLNSEQ